MMKLQLKFKLTLNFILLFIFLYSVKVSYSQSKIFVDKPHNGFSYIIDEYCEIDSIVELPENIQHVVNTIIQSALTGFKSNIVFIKGREFLLDSLTKKDSNFFLMKQVIPNYELIFELRDTNIGIKSYEIILELDKYGQIHYFNWPLADFNQPNLFVKVEEMEQTALKYAKKKRYKTKIVEYDFYFDDDKMVWSFSYLQKRKGDESHSTEQYVVIVINPLDNTVLEELGMVKSKVACY